MPVMRRVLAIVALPELVATGGLAPVRYADVATTTFLANAQLVRDLEASMRLTGRPPSPGDPVRAEAAR